MRLVVLDGLYMEENDLLEGRILFKQWQVQFEYKDGELFYPKDYYDSHHKMSRKWKNYEIYTIFQINGFQKLTLICLKQHFKFNLYLIHHCQYLTCGRVGDLSFLSPLISYHHFILEKKDLGWQIRDLNSENGIYLNGQRVYEKYLQLADVIFFAGKKIVFLNKYLLVEQPHETLLKQVNAKASKRKEKKKLDCHFHEEDLYAEVPIFKNTERKSVEEKKNKYDGATSILIYPMVMFLLNQDLSRFIFLIVSIGMILFRKGALYLNTRYQKKINKINDQQRYLINVLENVYKEYIIDHDYPLIEQLKQRFIKNGNYLYRIEKRQDYGTIRLGKEPILFNPFFYETIVFKYNSMHLLVYVFYQWLVYYPIKMIFLVDSLKDLEGLRYLSAIYHSGHFFVSFKKEDDLGLLEKMNDSKIIVFSKRKVKTKHLIIYLNIEMTCECMIDFCQGLYVDYVQSVVRKFEPLKMANFKFIYDHFKYKQVKLSNRLKSTHFFDQFPQPFDISRYYQNSDISECLKVHLGYEENNKPLILDLHDHPHVLIAGMTGAGKSELLNHFILSLAIYYSVEDLNFFLIDFKGGGLSHSFLELPHVCMTLTNLELEQTTRALYALKDELKKRQEILIKRSNQLGYHLRDIHDLKRSTFKNDFGHLMIVVDEFAELKKEYPDFLNELISISRVGRSLGVHLILSTQHPSGVVNQQILANMSTRIILRVSSKEDSIELLGSKKAIELNQPGEFFLLNQESIHKGRCLLIHEPLEQNCNQALLYDCVLKRQIELNYQKHSLEMTSYEYALCKIKLLCSPTKSLYMQHCPDAIPYKYSYDFRQIEIGVYDDFYNRKLTPLVIDGTRGVLWIGENLEAINALTTILRRKNNYCFGDLEGDYIYVNKNEGQLIQFLEQLSEDSLVIFYKQASKFETYLELFPYLSKQNHFTYCFIENNASFLRMRLLQAVGISLVNDNLNDQDLFNKKCQVSVKSTFQFKVQIDQVIYLGCLMEG